MSFQNRIEKLNNKLSDFNLDGLYVTNLTNVRYLTGFTGSAGSLLLIGDKCHFFTDGRYTEQAKEQINHCDIHIVGSAHYLAIKEKKIILNDANIGIESSFVSVNSFDSIMSELSHVKWHKIDDIIGQIAAVKDQHGINSLQTAIEITDQVFTEIIPELNGKIEGLALRVPTPNVSLVDLVFNSKNKLSINKINDSFKKASKKNLKNVLEVTEEKLVSIDFNHNSNSAIVDLSLTNVVGDKMGKVSAWYDNEWGFASRMCDLAEYIHKI